jgi:2-methylcitrate dehydratase PrpD
MDIPPSQTPSPAPPQNGGSAAPSDRADSPENKAGKKFSLALVVAVLIVLLAILLWGGDNQSEDADTADLREAKTAEMLDRVNRAGEVPLTESERQELARFVSDPDAPRRALSEEEARKIIDVLNR